jgi:N-acylneuraminate cytidylyltransferase
MSSLAIITARGGSKRIPRKNIKHFMGKPMLAYAIEAALSSGLFDEVMVSTDDNEIADIASTFGAKVPFLRSETTANDFATTRDVLLEVIDEYKKQGKEFDEFACIYPCVPFLTSEILCQAHESFSSNKADSLIPVVKYSFPIQRAVKINADGTLAFREIEYATARSQDLEPMYHDVGMFYFYRTQPFISNKAIKSIPFIMDERSVQDIDTMDDWAMAEMKYKILKGIS